MELSKKTTILFSDFLYKRLNKLAKSKHTSIGCLVREACKIQYGIVSQKEAIKAIDELENLSLPVKDVKEMKKELNPQAKDLLK